MYPPNVTHMPTKNAWLNLIDEAQTSIEIASFYWTLRFNELYPYNTSVEVSFFASRCIQREPRVKTLFPTFRRIFEKMSVEWRKALGLVI